MSDTTIIDWNRLTAQGRCKAPGIPWSAEERNAIYVLKIPVEDVRNGVLTLEDLGKGADKPKTLRSMTKAEVAAVAKELGIEFDEKVATKGDLVLEIEKAQKKAKAEEKKAKK